MFAGGLHLFAEFDHGDPWQNGTRAWTAKGALLRCCSRKILDLPSGDVKIATKKMVQSK